MSVVAGPKPILVRSLDGQSDSAANVALLWMVSKATTTSSIRFNNDWLLQVPHPVKPWGQLTPHDDRLQTPIPFALARSAVRHVNFEAGGAPQYPTLALTPSELIHPSVLEQDTSSWPKELKDAVHRARNDPMLLDPLSPLEAKLRETWSSLQPGKVVTPALTSLGPRIAKVVNSIANGFYSLLFWRK